MEKITTLPKAELHVHLEGTIRPEIARSLALKNNINLPDSLFHKDNQSYISHGFMDFLNAYDTLSSVIKMPEDYYTITLDYLKESAKDGVIYTEMMYSPDHAERASGLPSIEHLKAIQMAVDEAERDFNIAGRILATGVRHYGIESVEAAVKTIAKERVPCVVGFGLGGDEIHYPPELFKKAYEIAYNSGLKCTVHAGEFASFDTMKTAIKTLPIQRIGHGIASIFDENTLRILHDKQIALELCPTSNVFLGLVDSVAKHPFPLFYEQGIRVSINSDDPPFMKTNIGKEYQTVQAAYHYDDDTMRSICRMTIEDSFAEDALKKRLLKTLN